MRSGFVSLEPLSLSYESGDDFTVEELIEDLYTHVHPAEEKKDREFWEIYFQQVRESEASSFLSSVCLLFFTDCSLS